MSSDTLKVSNSKLLWILGTVAAAFIVAATTWNFTAVAGMPEKYVNKVENRQDHQEIKQDLKEIKNLIMNLHTRGNDADNSVPDGE